MAYNNAPSGSEAERAAFEKWLSFCTTLDEAREAYDNVPDGTEAQRAALRKIYDLFPETEEAPA